MGMKDEGMKTLLRRIKEILRECMDQKKGRHICRPQSAGRREK
jgi:hypothetical protein